METNPLVTIILPTYNLPLYVKSGTNRMENMLKIEKVNEIIQKSEEIEALREIKKRLLDIFDIKELKLFGSAVRAESDEESDIDLFILTKKHLSRIERHKITDVVFSINLHYGTNFSTTVIDVGSWE